MDPRGMKWWESGETCLGRPEQGWLSPEPEGSYEVKVVAKFRETVTQK
jgi:hypothetical protein